MRRGRLILIILLLIIVVIQFFPALPEDREEFPENNFVTIHDAPMEVQSIIETACNDCHSNISVWPWYAQVAPFSFWIGHHVEEGREHLNFSEWASYSEKKRDHKLEEIVEEVEKGKMPLNSYTWMHHDAKLSSEQIATLIEFVESQRILISQK